MEVVPVLALYDIAPLPTFKLPAMVETAVVLAAVKYGTVKLPRALSHVKRDEAPNTPPLLNWI